MAHGTVRLQSNGKYWTAIWSDSQGRRRAKGLGAKSRVSKRQAKVLCTRIAAEMQLNPSRIDAVRAPKLGEFVQRYLDSRTDLKAKTLELHQLTARYLITFFSDDIRIDRITRAMGADWRSAMATGQLTISGRVGSLAEAYICIHVRNAKTILSQAVKQDLILFNPFDRLKGTAPEPDKDWHYVSKDELRLLLSACPSMSWQLLLSLCRLAGVRQTEALDLPWAGVDWEQHTMAIFAPKTGRYRVVPIDPELYSFLLRAYEEASEGQEMVIPVGSIGRSNLWRDFRRICRRANLEPWTSWCQVLRRNCETDWAQEHPQYVVSTWIGHDITVSARHYLQVPKDLYDKVAGLKA